jgi:hypothetical protein
MRRRPDGVPRRPCARAPLCGHLAPSVVGKDLAARGPLQPRVAISVRLPVVLSNPDLSRGFPRWCAWAHLGAWVYRARPHRAVAQGGGGWHAAHPFYSCLACLCMPVLLVLLFFAFYRLQYYCLLLFGFDCYGCVQSTQSRSGLWGLGTGAGNYAGNWLERGRVCARSVVDCASCWARVHISVARVAPLASRAPLPFLARALPSLRRSLAPPPGLARALAVSLLPALCASPACGLAIGCCMRYALRNSAWR